MGLQVLFVISTAASYTSFDIESPAALAVPAGALLFANIKFRLSASACL